MKKTEREWISRWYKKIRAINLLSGKCQECGEDRPWLLAFHHKDPKEKDFEINELLRFRWSILEKEALKCKLLCQNCHRKAHFKEETQKIKSKKIILEITCISGCEICGYNEYVGALEFHHQRDKNFNIGSISFIENSGEKLKKKLLEEIDKCTVLCANCHQDLHFDKEKFNNYKKEIENFEYKELKPSLNENDVMKLYNKGMKQIDIAKEFQRNVSVICRIIQRCS